jgi:multiple sugar transport system permease protein
MVGERPIGTVLRYAGVGLVLLIVLFPVYWMVNMSFKDTAEFTARPPTMIVDRPTWENYRNILVEQDFDRYAQNSLITAIVAASVAVVIGSLMAYALSRFRLPKNFNYHLLFTILTVRMFPPILSLIPLYYIYKQVGLLDTRLGLGLIHAWTEIPLVVWMMIGFFRDIPRDMEEAALVDGDTRLGVLRKIAVPLARPGLAATFILVFISSWNEFLFALILNSRNQTLPIAVAGQITQFEIRYGNLMAAGVFATVPVLILAFLTQRHLTRGLTVGGVTG